MITYIHTHAIQFFVNMIIAGIIIFGGGPVVIPLLRGYTVDNGMRHIIENIQLTNTHG